MFDALSCLWLLAAKEFISGTMELSREKNKGGFDAFEAMLEQLAIVEMLRVVEFRFAWAAAESGGIEIERWIKTSTDWSIYLFLQADGQLSRFKYWWIWKWIPYPCTVRIEWSAKYETFSLEFNCMPRSRVRSFMSALAKIAYEAHLAYQATREGASADAAVQVGLGQSYISQGVYMGPPSGRTMSLPVTGSDME